MKDELRYKLDRINMKDKKLKRFGAKAHKYALNPVLSGSRIQTIETKYRISLPEDYRWFLLNVGDGGAGPYYGIRPLNESIEEVLDWLEEEDPPGETFFPIPFKTPKTVEASMELYYFSPGMHSIFPSKSPEQPGLL